jgi:REP-associated tyrosine transposase
MAGTITAKNQKPIIVNGVSDHVHLLICLRPSMAISDLVRDVKNSSSKFINDKKFMRGNFSWQNGFGAFTYSHSQMDNVYNYILNQERHHKKRGFKEEYLDLLRKFDVNYDPQYLFDWPL